MLRTRLLNYLVFLVLVSALLGCRSKPSPMPTSSPLESPLVEDSPISTSTPRPTLEPTEEIRPFQLDKPIQVGATRVTGRGPANVPVVLMDITLGGVALSVSAVDQRGEFEFKLSEPLEARHRIGITLADLSGTEWKREDFYSEAYHGDEAFSVPNVGFFFDTYMIQE
jgi:hypothetical protein